MRNGFNGGVRVVGSTRVRADAPTAFGSAATMTMPRTTMARSGRMAASRCPFGRSISAADSGSLERFGIVRAVVHSASGTRVLRRLVRVPAAPHARPRPCLKGERSDEVGYPRAPAHGPDRVSLAHPQVHR